MNKSFRDKITGICFLGILAGAVVANITTADRSFSKEENRYLQEMPSLNVSQCLDGRFERHFENYTNDQFPFRNSFIKIKTSMDRSLGVVESNGVYLGRDDYLFEDIVTPEEDRLERAETALKSFKKNHKNLRMYFLLAPTAGNVMREKLPATLRMADQNAYMDNFFGNIRKDGYKPLDIREKFNRIKADEQLYYRTDHHWTTDGAYEAYKTAIGEMGFDSIVKYERKVVKNNFNGTLYSKSGFTNGASDEIKVYLPTDKKSFRQSVIEYSDVDGATTEYYNLNKLKTKDAYEVFGGGNHPMITIKTPVNSERKLLVIKDSYANCFVPFLTQYFREIVVIDPRYYFDSVDDILETEKITDVMFLYNANTFFADDSLAMMLGDTK